MISFTFYVTTIALLSTLLRPCRTSTLPFQGTNFPWQNPARLTTINHDLRADLQSYPKRSLNYSLALPIDFPDPSIYKVDDRYWAFATTNNVDTNVQVATSSDFKTWIYLQDYDALPFAGTWTYNITSANGWQSPRTWAPNVIQNDEGLWVMYYSALATQDLHCTGVATATNIQGPYVPIDDEPLVCPLEVGGAIDASGFKDVDGTRWIVYKIDGNSLGNGGSCNNDIPPIHSTPILLQQVGSDGYSLVDSPIQILDRSDVTLDGPLIEAPALAWTSDGRYILFFSSNCYSSELYDISYAIADIIEGPYTKYGPFALNSTTGLYGPGGAHISQYNEGQIVQRMAFHAGPIGQRWMYTAEIEVDGYVVETI